MFQPRSADIPVRSKPRSGDRTALAQSSVLGSCGGQNSSGSFHQTPMIEVRDLKKRFGQNLVLDEVSFRIETGESLVIIGRSGGGKSVLLKHLIALLKPDSGQVLIEGENIVPLDERQLLRVRHKFGMLFQGAALFDSMTVAENVAFAFRRDRLI